MSLDPLRRAAGGLFRHFFSHLPGGPHPYVQSIGIGSDSIRVMLVREPMGHEEPIPPEWEGFRVETRVVGRIVIGG